MTDRPGPIGALFAEYRRALDEYLSLIEKLGPIVYEMELDTNQEEAEMNTIKGILMHTLMAGYGYANAFRRKWDIPQTSPKKYFPEYAEVTSAMNAMFEYSEATFEGRWGMKDEEMTATNIPLRWSDHHDIEALLEHAVMHIHRHRRQIEKLVKRAVGTPVTT